MSVARKKRTGERPRPNKPGGQGPGKRSSAGPRANAREGPRVKKPAGVRPGGFARKLLSEWRRRGWATEGEPVVLGVSGGADSTALLLALEELTAAGLLGLSLTVAHLDHSLRGERGAEDARWVEELARARGFEAVLGRADVGELARAGRDNLEQAARRARYEFLKRVARQRGARAVLVAHTLDDQAETVLLRLLRGSGAEGLCGMLAERALAEGLEDARAEGLGDARAEGVEASPAGGLEVVLRRPLLSWARRADTESYCRARGAEFRTDDMNEDERFARVRVRRQLLPLLESFNPRASEAIARAAELLREDASALELLASRLLEDAREGSEVESHGAGPLRVAALKEAPAALRRRALRQWIGRGRGGLRRLSLAHLLAVERLLEGERGGRVAELPGGCRVERRRGLLRFLPVNNR